MRDAIVFGPPSFVLRRFSCCACETITTPTISTSAPSSASSAGRSPASSASSALTTANAEAIGDTSASVPIAKAR